MRGSEKGFCSSVGEDVQQGRLDWEVEVCSVAQDLVVSWINTLSSSPLATVVHIASGSTGMWKRYEKCLAKGRASVCTKYAGRTVCQEAIPI